MLERLKALFASSTPAQPANAAPSPIGPREGALDPVLGELQWVEEDGWWEARLDLEDESVEFNLGGDQTPSPAILAQAQAIVRRYPEFLAEVREHLAKQAASSPALAPYAPDLERLHVQCISLCWPERPGDGMLYLDGPGEDRLWRCDLIGGKPVGLEFDE